MSDGKNLDELINSLGSNDDDDNFDTLGVDDSSDDDSGNPNLANVDRFQNALEGFSLPKVPDYNVAKELNYRVNAQENILIDHEDVQAINTTINSLRVAMFKIADWIVLAERREKTIKTNYERKLRREYLTSTEKTDARRKEYAALMCEEEENDLVYIQQVKAELIRYSRLLDTEFSTMNTLSNNMRQQLKHVY